MHGEPEARPPAAATPDLPAIELEVSGRWALGGLAARATASTAGGQAWTYFGEPLAATGLPSLAYLRERALEDLYCRLAVMRGLRVSRYRYLDCHGLDVEVSVARQLGLAGPQDIHAYGVGPFVARCRESVLRHLTQLTVIAGRLGCVTGPADIQLTMDAGFAETVWSRLSQAFEAGLLVKDRRLGRYCPRCRTQVAEHEISQPGALEPVALKPGAGLAVTARSRLGELPQGAPSEVSDADLLVSTSAPWTLVASTGVALDPGRTYVMAKRAGHDDRVLLAEDRFARVLGDGWHVAARLSGRELIGATCQVPFERARPAGGAPVPLGWLGTARADDAAASASATGIAPWAPAYGAGQLSPGGAAPDEATPICQDGCFSAELPAVGGLFFAEAGPAVAADLSDRGLLFRARPISPRLPHCWCCGTVLLSKAMSGWHLKAPASSDRLAPGCDLALSRERYWGVPLPIWECEQGHATCIRSLAELARLSGCDLRGVDPHRPAVDLIAIRCGQCGTPARRIPEVTDSRLDVSIHDGQYPVVSVTRCGERGDLAEPWPLIERFGADALRWSLIMSSRARSAHQAQTPPLGQITRQILHRYWHCARFCTQRASAVTTAAPRPAGRPALDRWLLSELQSVTAAVTAALAESRPDRAIRRLDGVIADLSGWYIRLCRHRFAPGSDCTDRAAAAATLRESLIVLTKLLAPFVPFLSDFVWNLIRDPGTPDSVHLAGWPQPATDLIDERLSGQIHQLHRIVRAGRAARARARVGCRQPLPQARIAPDLVAALSPDLLAIIARELNVKSLQPAPAATRPEAHQPGWAVAVRQGCRVALDLRTSPSLRLEGLARTATRAIQRARQHAGLSPGDPIAVYWSTTDTELARALSDFGPQISRVVLAAQYHQVTEADAGASTGATTPNSFQHRSDKLTLTLWLSPIQAPLTIDPTPQPPRTPA